MKAEAKLLTLLTTVLTKLVTP